MEETLTVKELDSLVDEIFTLREEIDSLENIKSEKNKKLNDLLAKGVGYLTDLNRENYKSPRGSISVREIRRWSNPSGEDKPLFLDWLKSEGIFDQTISINNNTLNSLIKSKYEACPNPMEFKIPGLKDPTVYTTLSVRKS